MALLNFTIDTDDLYDRETSFDDLLTDELQSEIMTKVRESMKVDIFKEFADLTSETIITGVRVKMANFLNEDIALTDRWGKPTFIGSVEDLMKLRVDEVLLRPVNNDGKTLEGESCSSTGHRTWLEWRITTSVEEQTNRHVKDAVKFINQNVLEEVKSQMATVLDIAVKEKIAKSLAAVLDKK